MTRTSALAVLVLLLFAPAAPAVITKLTPLGEVLESDQFIFVAKAEALDPDNKDRPTATFTVIKKLKGAPPFDRIPVNMTGDDEAKKAGDTKTIFERLDTTRELVFFVRKQGKLFNAKVFVEGSWFSAYGQLDADGKTVRWAFLHGEPFLRRTFKGTSAEMVKTVEDALAKKAKPPEPDEKEKPGYGPAVVKKSGQRTEDRGQGAAEIERQTTEDAQRVSTASGRSDGTTAALFGVIPSFVLAGPLAIIAALFPGVFARMAVGMKRWRAFLVVASTNSTLALLYWVVLTYRAHWLADVAWLSPNRFTLYLAVIALVGLVWAGRRYRQLAARDAAVTATPHKTELYVLLGLTAFAAAATALTAVFSSWGMTVALPMREFTFIGIALLTATVYAAYRAVTKRADVLQPGSEPPLRLSLSGESVGLGVLVICAFTTLLLASGRGGTGPGVGTVQKGDAEADFGPRLAGDPVALIATDDDGPVFGRIMSNLTLDGDRLYFGADNGGEGGGSIVCMNRGTGKLHWQVFNEGDTKTQIKVVYCTPTVANGKLYCGEGTHKDKGCRMFGLSAADGSAVWKPQYKTEKGHTEGKPVLVGDRLYFPAGDDGLICADANTGKQHWQYTGNGKDDVHIDAPPVFADGTLYAGSGLFNYVAVALDAATGKEKWRTDLKLRVFGAPTVSGGKVFYGVGTGNMGEDIATQYEEEGPQREKAAAGAVCCLDAATGKEEWRYPLTKAVHTGLAVDPFTVYAGCRDGSVYALDRKTGKRRWALSIGGRVQSSPTVATAGGFPVAVYAVSQEGNVVCLNPQTGAIAWQAQLPGFTWAGNDEHAIMCAPLVVTTPTATGSKRTIYIGGRTLDPGNPNTMRIAVFKFEDVIGE